MKNFDKLKVYMKYERRMWAQETNKQTYRAFPIPKKRSSIVENQTW